MTIDWWALVLVALVSIAMSVVFVALLAVSGVGPKSALGVLAEMTIDQIAQAVADDKTGAVEDGGRTARFKKSADPDNGGLDQRHGAGQLAGRRRRD